ncbi:Centrosomal protein of 89 kDa [Orchesella cincta]|uniref:Centrosomal protein of 89 kDa n=1 Tax=Orchesella cincta TaxID=48709 RepID=A0A1D2N8X6_ORCCI|nr:Centrosomal protein of 89 kDa [Orchesella cincta]
MEEEPSSLVPKRESSFPEKPLESGDKNGSNGSGTKTAKSKPSKFKSIFTKTSRRSLSQEVETNSSDKDKGRKPAGKGDTTLAVTEQPNNQEKLNPNQGVMTLRRTNTPKGDASQSSPRVEAQTERSRKSTNVPNASAPSNPSSSRGRRKEVTISEERDEHPHHSHERDRVSSSSRGKHCGSGARMGGQVNKVRDPKTFKRSTIQMKQKNRELLASQEKEVYQVLKENESLNLEICKLSQEIDEWRAKCQKMENKSTALTKAKSLSKENKEMVEDIEVLKSVICRLNKELAFYQDRLRFKYRSAPENIPNYSTSSGTDLDEADEGGRAPGAATVYSEDSKDWLQFPRKSLLPLLVAYDEVIAEKEEIIRDHELTIDRFKARCMEIIRENQEMHRLVSDNKDRGTISIEEWESLRTNAIIVLDENELLHDQVSNFKRKEEVIIVLTSCTLAGNYKQTVTQLDAEVNRLKSTISDLEAKCRQLSEDNLTISASMQARIPRDRHDAMVQEFKQSFEELKSTYQSDRKGLTDKITSVEKERDRLVGEVTNLETENAKLRGDLRDCENNLATNTISLQKVKAAMIEATSARDATNTVIEDFMKHVQELACEKKKLNDDLQEQKLLNEQMMGLRIKENELVAQLHEKIEAMERLHNDEVRAVQARLKELERELIAQCDRHRKEKAQLNELLKEKEKRIEAVETSKKQLQVDLETVWRTTTNTMQTSFKNRFQQPH